jgi:hypothetical protein
VHLSAGRVEQLWSVEQTQPRHHDSDPSVIERPHELGDCCRLDDRVRIQEHQRVRA